MLKYILSAIVLFSSTVLANGSDINGISFKNINFSMTQADLLEKGFVCSLVGCVSNSAVDSIKITFDHDHMNSLSNESRYAQRVDCNDLIKDIERNLQQKYIGKIKVDYLKDSFPSKIFKVVNTTSGNFEISVSCDNLSGSAHSLKTTIDFKDLSKLDFSDSFK